MFNVQIKSLPKEDICLLVRPANHPWDYLIDCGEASLLTSKECQNLRALFISHTHMDHFMNFDTLLRHQLGVGREIIISGPEGIAKRIQSRIQSYIWNLIFDRHSRMPQEIKFLLK